MENVSVLMAQGLTMREAVAVITGKANKKIMEKVQLLKVVVPDMKIC